MKQLLILISIAVLLVATGISKEVDKAKLDAALTSFKQAINSNNAGVRYSALYQIARLKSDHPDYNLNDFKDILLIRSQTDNNNLVRIHALLTYLYINSKDLPKKIVAANPEDPMPFYTSLHQELHNKQFGVQDLTKEELLQQLQKLIKEL